MAASSLRKVRDQLDAEQLLSELQRSRRDLRSFCRDRGIDGRSLACWQRRLDRRTSPPPAPAPPLRLLEIAPPQAPVQARYRLCFDDFVLELDDHFQPETLTRLLAVVRAC